MDRNRKAEAVKMNLLNVECSFIESVFVESDMIDWMLHKLTEDSTRFIRQSDFILPNEPHRFG